MKIQDFEKYSVPIEKERVFPLLAKGEEVIMVDLDRRLVMNVFASTYPSIEAHIHSENVYFYQMIF